MLDYHGGGSSDNGGADVENAGLSLPLPIPPSDTTVVVKWAMLNATNDWYWAIDNVSLTDEGPTPTPSPTPTPVPIIVTGPYVQFLGQNSVKVYWETNDPGSSILEYTHSGSSAERLVDETPKTNHQMTLTGLRADTEYEYAIKTEIGGMEMFGGTFEFDSTFDDSPGPFPSVTSPYPEDDLTPLYAAAAERIVQQTGVEKGYCLVFGFGEGRLAYEIAARTQMKVIGIEEDSEKIAQARALLDETGVYGNRISVQQGSLSDLPYQKYFANLIVSDNLLSEGQIGGTASELYRVLRPCGGMIYMGQPLGAPTAVDRAQLESWLTAGGITGFNVTDDAAGLWISKEREALANTGEWTHHYAEPGNSASSGDQLIENTESLLWFGRPGPRLAINRHSRPMSPLYKNGRVFTPADDRIIAFDAYNGTRLWDLSVPGSRRLGAFKGCAQTALTGEYLYIAQGKQCHAVNVETGIPVLTLRAPQLVSGQERDWGYVACIGGRILGSGHEVGTPFYEYSGNGNCDELEGDGRACMVSDYLFCQNRLTGESLWTYQAGAILESAIASGEGLAFFAENRSLPPASGPWEGPGRRWVGNFTSGSSTYLVALDGEDGTLEWETQVNLPFTEMMYLSYSDGIVLTVGSYNVGSDCYYGLHAFRADNGQPVWNTSYDSGHGPGGSHGEQWQHPVIMNGTIYMLNASCYDLVTGAKGSFALTRGGGGCGTISGASSHVFARGSNPRMYEVQPSGATGGAPLCQVTRPGCFINIIPAGGLVLLPPNPVRGARAGTRFKPRWFLPRSSINESGKGREHAETGPLSKPLPYEGRGFS